MKSSQDTCEGHGTCAAQDNTHIPQTIDVETLSLSITNEKYTVISWQHIVTCFPAPSLPSWCVLKSCRNSAIPTISVRFQITVFGWQIIWTSTGNRVTQPGFVVWYKFKNPYYFQKLLQFPTVDFSELHETLWWNKWDQFIGNWSHLCICTVSVNVSQHVAQLSRSSISSPVKNLTIFFRCLLPTNSGMRDM
jgi:hypothetical protein